MSRFVTPAEIRLPLTDGDFVVVKEKLNAGETLDLFERMKNEKTGDMDPLRVAIATAVTYLLDWSLTDDAGRVVVVRDQPGDVVAAVLRGLEYEDFREVVDTIQAHDDRVKAARQEKKRNRGVTASDSILPLPVDAIGVTSG
jgi:hypothetical protein